MPKVLFNIAYTAPTPPSYLKGNRRAEYIARRKFYNLTSNYNFFTYALNGKKIIKNANAEHYFTREGNNTGLFNFDGALDESQTKLIKDKLKNSKSIIWHGFVSFEESLTEAFSTQESAVKFIRQTFGVFLKNAKFNPNNIELYAALHKDTDNRHIHFAFFEKEPKHRDKNGVLGYRRVGKIDSKAIDNYLVSANMHVDEHVSEYFGARDKAIKELRNVCKQVETGVLRNVELNRGINNLIAAMPKIGRLQYGAPNMADLRFQIDHVANLLIASSPKVNEANKEMLKQFARVKNSVTELVRNNKLAYVNGRRMSKNEINDAMGDKSDIDMRYVNINNVDYFDKLKFDFRTRVGNVVIGMCKAIKQGDLRDAKRCYKANDKNVKISVRRKREKRIDVIRSVQKMLFDVCTSEKADFLTTVQRIEQEYEYSRRVVK